MTQPSVAEGAAPPPAAKRQNGAERLLRAAVEAGVEVCFANPGTMARFNYFQARRGDEASCHCR